MESWLHEDVEAESSDPENSEGGQIGNELESRLSSIIHHNNLNEPLPPELAKHYSLHQSDDGDVTVTLHNSLDDSLGKINIDETEVMDIEHISDDEKSDNVVIVSELTKPQYSNKRVRYPDINIDLINDTQQNNINVDRPLDAECDPVEVFSNVEYLQELVLSKKHGSFAHVNIPTTIEFSDWKSDSKANFIPIGKRPDKNPKIKFELRKALEKINPNVSQNQLSRRANIFTGDCAKRWKRVKNKEPQYNKSNTFFNALRSETQTHCINKNKGDNLMYNRKYINNLLTKTDHIEDISTNIAPSFCLKSPEIKPPETPNKNKINGSVSLSSSHFRPEPKDIEPNVERAVETNNKSLLKNKSQFPSKWSKKMVSFYTKPYKTKLDASIEDILQNLNNTSTSEDWQIDPRDETGVYHRPVSKLINIRCSNCKRRGHLDTNCPEPKNTKMCIFCGGSYHYWNPEGICIKTPESRTTSTSL